MIGYCILVGTNSAMELFRLGALCSAQHAFNVNYATIFYVAVTLSEIENSRFDLIMHTPMQLVRTIPHILYTHLFLQRKKKMNQVV